MAAIDDLNVAVIAIQDGVAAVTAKEAALNQIIAGLQTTVADLQAQIAANDPSAINAQMETAVAALTKAKADLDALS